MFSESRNNRRRRIGDRAAADRLRDRDNAAGIGDNSGGTRRWCRRDRRYRRERDPMLNSVLNGDWSNSVPRRKIPEGQDSRAHNFLVHCKLSYYGRVNSLLSHTLCHPHMDHLFIVYNINVRYLHLVASLLCW